MVEDTPGQQAPDILICATASLGYFSCNPEVQQRIRTGVYSILCFAIAHAQDRHYMCLFIQREKTEPLCFFREEKRQPLKASKMALFWFLFEPINNANGLDKLSGLFRLMNFTMLVKDKFCIGC